MANGSYGPSIPPRPMQTYVVVDMADNVAIDMFDSLEAATNFVTAYPEGEVGIEHYRPGEEIPNSVLADLGILDDNTSL